MSTAKEPTNSPQDALGRGRRWIAGAIAIGVLLYVGYALLRGWSDTADALSRFYWPMCIPVLGLTLVNYGLRYVKWTYLLGKVDVRLPHRTNLVVFATGLAMVISPGKAGELIKPWLVSQCTTTPMTRTIPALIAERGTDGIAVALLAAWGVSTYSSDGVGPVMVTLCASALGIGLLSSESATAAMLQVARKLPLLGRIVPSIADSLLAMRSCLAPGPLLFTVFLSLVAWWAECLGYWLVFRGLEVMTATLDTSTFLYAFATLGGGPSPGGLGLADAFLVEGSTRLIEGLQPAQAVAAALLIRVATLWFGVIMGAFALLGVDRILPNPP